MAEIIEIKEKIVNKFGVKAKIINLTDQLPQKDQKVNEAAVLYLPNIVDQFLGKGSADKLY